MPGTMPPLEMVKAAAIDAIVKLRDKEALPEVEVIARSNNFYILREKARQALSALGQK